MAPVAPATQPTIDKPPTAPAEPVETTNAPDNTSGLSVAGEEDPGSALDTAGIDTPVAPPSTHREP